MLTFSRCSETHLLVTNITEIDPDILSFSPDGGSFYVFDQSAFAQKYLPQYFKHSNYGSFVRQLNLYGFTSSRHKDNTEVVVWSHEYFHRDRKDLLKKIKRTVKKPTKKDPKPCHVHIAPRSASALSVSSEEVSSSPSHDCDDVPNEPFSRQVSSKGEEWLESEFAYLKQQNRHLEQKLDLLLKITLTLSPSSLEEFQLGEKRRRTFGGSSIPAHHQSYQNAQRVLGTIREDHRVPSNDGIEPMPYRHENRRPHKSAEVDNQESMKAFVDIMLSEEEKDECEANSGSDSDITNEDNVVQSARGLRVTNTPADTYEDELMAEAMHAILPNNDFCDDDEFNLSFDEHEELPENIPAPGTFLSVSNRVEDKSSGPQPVLSSDSYDFRGDIEEGNAPLGVHIVSARAELVDDDSRKDDDSFEDRRSHRRKVVCILSFMFVVLLVTCVTIPTVMVKQNRQKIPPPRTIIFKEEGRDKGKPFGPPPTKGPYQGGHAAESNNDDDEFYAFKVNTTEARTGTRIAAPNIFSNQPLDNYTARSNPLFLPDDISVTIGEIDFICAHVPR
jgi:hypothetical protein